MLNYGNTIGMALTKINNKTFFSIVSFLSRDINWGKIAVFLKIEGELLVSNGKLLMVSVLPRSGCCKNK